MVNARSVLLKIAVGKCYLVKRQPLAGARGTLVFRPVDVRAHEVMSIVSIRPTIPVLHNKLTPKGVNLISLDHTKFPLDQPHRGNKYVQDTEKRKVQSNVDSWD